MMKLDAQTGKEALQALIRERSLLGALKVMYRRAGRIFQVPMATFHPFVVGGPKAARQVLITHRDHLSWRNPDPVTDVLRRGVLVTDGPEHDHYRGLMEGSLHPSVIPAYHGDMLASTDKVSAQWRDGQTVDMLVESRKIALLIVMQTLFSVDVWDDMPRIWHPLLKVIERISPGTWIVWRKIPSPWARRNQAILDKYLYGIIASRRASPPRKDMLQHLLDAGLDDDRIRDQMITMLIAGHDTSTALLAWVFHLLSLHPDVHAQLVRDIDAALGDREPGKDAGWHPPLLDHVVKEALRMYPPIHLGNRMVEKDMEFEGERVAAGERLLYSIYLTQHDPEYWDKPDEFNPDRFITGNKTPFAFIPFGGGPRSCIGSAFGQVEARIVLARLFQTHTFEMKPSKAHPHMGATLEPRPGVPARVTRRVRQSA